MSEEVKEEKKEEEKACCCGKCGKKKPLWLRILCIVLIVLIVLFIVGVTFAGTICEQGIERVGSFVTKCSVNVDDVSVSLLRGRLTISNLVLSNPEGYKSEYAFKLGKVDVSMDVKSIFSNKIHMNEILIDGPEITYEMALTSNIGAIQKNVNSLLPKKDGAKEDEKAKAAKKGGKTVQIDKVTVSNGRIKLAVNMLGGAGLPIPLPTISMSDIGKDKEVTSEEATAEVLNRTCEGVVAAATKSGTDVTNSLKDTGSKMADSVKGLFGGKKDDK